MTLESRLLPLLSDMDLLGLEYSMIKIGTVFLRDMNMVSTSSRRWNPDEWQGEEDGTAPISEEEHEDGWWPSHGKVTLLADGLLLSLYNVD